MSEHEQIARVDSPGADLFFRDFVSRRRPAIVSRATGGWKALALWDADYFKAAVGSTEVRVEVSPTNYFPDIHGQDDAARVERRVRLMDFNSFAAAISDGNRTADRHYMSQEFTADKFPALAGDFRRPACLDARLSVKNSLWLGPAGTVTPLHYDLVHNLFAQIRGRKRFTLFAPEHLPRLYPFPFHSKLAHFSRVEVESPDFVKFPKFRLAVPLELTLEPGEMLYLPPFWWHQVRALDEAVSLSFWWKLPWSGYFARPALRLTYSLLKDLIKGS